MNKLKSTTLYIVRHGETQLNLKKVLQGHADSPLTILGQTQARTLRSQLKDIHFDAAFSSDLLRSKKTAEIILLERNLVLKTTRLLRERSFGRFEGKSYTIFANQLKQELAKFKSLSQEKKFKFKYAKDVESDAEIVSRFITFLREIALAYAGKTLLVVSHGGMMRALLIHLGFGDYDSLPPGAVKNTAYFALKTDGIEFAVLETYGINKVATA